MSIDMASSFESSRATMKASILDVLSSEDQSLSVEGLKSTFENVQYSDAEKRIVCDQAFKDILIQGVKGYSSQQFEKIIQLSLNSAEAEICSPVLPIILLTDAFEILSLNKCEEIFCIVEGKVAVWKQPLFFNTSKNTLLRLCNDLLRRLSRSQNTVFCGRILLFLAKFFPFSERSGLNVVSEFNLDNFTIYGVKDETATSETGLKTEPKEQEETSFQTDYNLYKKFWSLQDYFRNPSQCYSKVPWKMFCMHTNDVLSAFSTIKLDERRTRDTLKSSVDGDTAMDVDENCQDAPNALTGNVQQYFAKYLTSQNLLELQLSDSNFRRFVLIQFLIMFQYLDAPVKFKQESHKLTDDQTLWANEAAERVYKLLEDTPPDGAAFAASIRHILKREEIWSNWKNEGCLEFLPKVANDNAGGGNGSTDAAAEKKVVPGRARRPKRSLGDQVRDATKKSKTIIGNAEMTRLWNLFPDNMAACRAKDRDFLPSLETYFEEAIEQLDPSVESQYKRINNANFGWRALRLLARRSPHFFTHGNTPITRLPDYLETHVKKLAKDFQVSNVVATTIPEPVNEAEVEQMEPEAETTASDAVEETVKNGATAASDEGDAEDGEATRNGNEDEKKVELCTMEQLQSLAQKLGADWKKLAPKLGFRADEIEYFESENADAAAQARTMFQIWLENEPDATPENLLYTLEGLGLQATAQGILI